MAYLSVSLTVFSLSGNSHSQAELAVSAKIIYAQINGAYGNFDTPCNLAKNKNNADTILHKTLIVLDHSTNKKLRLPTVRETSAHDFFNLWTALALRADIISITALKLFKSLQCAATRIQNSI